VTACLENDDVGYVFSDTRPCREKGGRLEAHTSLAVKPRRRTARSRLAHVFVGVSPRARPSVWRDALLRRMLGLADLTAALVALWSTSIADSAALVYAPVWIVNVKLWGLYDRDKRELRHLTVDEVPRLLAAAVGSTFALAAFGLAYDAGLALAQGSLIALITAAGACVMRAVVRFAWRRVTPPERIAIVGDGPAGAAMRRKLELFGDIHATVVHEQVEVPAGGLDGQAEWLDEVDRVIVVSEATETLDIRELVTLGRRRHVKVSMIPCLNGMLGSAVQLTHVADMPILDYSTWDVPRSTRLLKRLLDLLLASVLLLVSLPVMLAIAALIKLDSRGPVLFKQRRAGLEGRPFWMLKFRTMVVDAEALLPQLVSIDALREPVFKFESDPRMTRVGRRLRSWSLDELPQLVNVVRGEMSLVGPRPEQLELVTRYTELQRDRLSVKPGMTGPMQVYGRGRLSLEERLAVEREYIHNPTIARDLRILGLTLPAVFNRRGAY
jgi:exopolysaccharide biosynthesis polyprenyl glycosylphosphotransferase